MLVLDSVYRIDGAGDRGLPFVPTPAPSRDELETRLPTIAERIGRSLERAGLIMRDIENSFLAFDPADEAPINALLGHSITYRIATAPREGQKVFTLQTLPPNPDQGKRDVAESSGFSLHAGTSAKAAERDKLERLVQYVSRPPVATERLALTEAGQVRYALKSPYKDGTTHRREIVIHIRPVPHLAFEPSCPPSNVLRIQLDPDRMALGVNMNGPGEPFDLQHVELVADFAPQNLPAYARLLLDVMRGDLTLSIRDDEAGESWRIVAPILDAWKANRVPLLDYAAGSAGPGGT